MEEDILLAIHGWSRPFLDVIFLVSHELGRGPFGLILVVVMVALWWRAGDRSEARLWAVLGLSTYFLQLGLKHFFARPRPALWDPLVHLSSFAMPSGHALAAATLYPLLARSVARRWPSVAPMAYGVAVFVAFYIGFGRLYLGVHWPSDVLVGWAIGAAQTVAMIRWSDRRGSLAEAQEQ
jgi:undecaprenyl-diphosphatase